jgi:hypothetical protein
MKQDHDRSASLRDPGIVFGAFAFPSVETPGYPQRVATRRRKRPKPLSRPAKASRKSNEKKKSAVVASSRLGVA